MGSNVARTIGVTHDIERRPTTTEARVAYDSSVSCDEYNVHKLHLGDIYSGQDLTFF